MGRWLWICKFTDEIFTSCIDVNIIGSSSSPTPSQSPVAPVSPSVPETDSLNEAVTPAPAAPETEPEPSTPSPTIPTPAPTIPTPAPTSAPSTPAPTPSQENPTPSQGTPGMTCKAIPGLRRGVSDASCAKCANGYKWWPCNDATLCECTSSSLVQRSVRRESRKQSSSARFLGPSSVS